MIVYAFLNLYLFFKNLYPVSIITENKSVEMMLYAKNGIAKVKHVSKPEIVWPYIPLVHTPKLVTTKNIQAPTNAPLTRQLKFLVNY